MAESGAHQIHQIQEKGFQKQALFCYLSENQTVAMRLTRPYDPEQLDALGADVRGRLVLSLRSPTYEPTHFSRV
jgi:hypothetical protein